MCGKSGQGRADPVSCPLKTAPIATPTAEPVLSCPHLRSQRASGGALPSARYGDAVFWFLVPWAGLAATLLSALLGATPGRTAAAALTSEGHGPATRLLIAGLTTIAFGIFFYPIAYAALFETMQRADIAAGAGLGAIHGLVAAIATWRHTRTTARSALHLILARIAYGALFGALYILGNRP
jgi:hypothetical protein